MHTHTLLLLTTSRGSKEAPLCESSTPFLPSLPLITAGFAQPAAAKQQDAHLKKRSKPAGGLYSTYATGLHHHLHKCMAWCRGVVTHPTPMHATATTKWQVRKHAVKGSSQRGCECTLHRAKATTGCSMVLLATWVYNVQPLGYTVFHRQMPCTRCKGLMLAEHTETNSFEGQHCKWPERP